MKAPLRILSIDGGGTRGVIPATILNCLKHDTGQDPVDLFDVIVGTSTGGIIASALLAGVPTERLVQLYQTEARAIFDDSPWDDLRDGFGKNLGADYSQKRLKKILTRLLGPTTLGDIHARYQGNKILMVTSFDLNPVDEAGRPVNFRSVIYNSAFRRDEAQTLVDLALRTSAGPTYFPIYQQFIDGGVAINHPAMAAVAFALNCNDVPPGAPAVYLKPTGVPKGLCMKSSADVHVLSLSCGTSNMNYITRQEIQDRNGGNWGNLQWIKYLPDLLTEANVQVSDYYVRQVLPDRNYLRIVPAFDDPAAPPLLRQINREKRGISLDTTQRAVLDAMHTYAKDVYDTKKPQILQWIRDSVRPASPTERAPVVNS